MKKDEEMGRATTRISLKTIAMLFPYDSAERVYLHGKWQKERGRHPSMNYGNHPTPKQAFAAVEEMLGKYFDEIRHQDYSRHDYFWSEDTIEGVMKRISVCDLPSVHTYQPL